ncbi:hypothetical protein CXG45_03230 [Pseudomonas plecoglossicida]|uniref:Uncharacterized protein n=1 Tax=Pseudomonas plecoglossicida TaxID=70775 RepID=A0ABX4U4Z7_PSEDL|nr:hypothetical protein CX682_24010 [Pseudomonas sp. FFUP_PS_41]PLU88852.1 hypothetical protein CXG44_03870 [Pseudomonas plecoglossicida]PLU95054.1 hypothetical protein CXG45_03230 [Pseudomonas plecoglossicida]PLV05428.1 hypothetical protein CXG48_06475 [Pseudomonas plecoglossicida]PLV15670.1 hypothetical protein CXG47_07505 [Pseudomonas plecoglossicida]
MALCVVPCCGAEGVRREALFVGAALCRERAAQRPQDFNIKAEIAGAAMRPFRDTRPLLQGIVYCLTIRKDDPAGTPGGPASTVRHCSSTPAHRIA